MYCHKHHTETSNSLCTIFIEKILLCFLWRSFLKNVLPQTSHWNLQFFMYYLHKEDFTMILMTKLFKECIATNITPILHVLSSCVKSDSLKMIHHKYHRHLKHFIHWNTKFLINHKKDFTVLLMTKLFKRMYCHKHHTETSNSSCTIFMCNSRFLKNDSPQISQTFLKRCIHRCHYTECVDATH